MRASFCTVCLLILVPAAAHGAAEFSSSPIFPLQAKHVHGSSIVEAPNGDLVACWFYGSGERSANDVQIQGARRANGAERWSPVFVMADTPGLPDCNPAMFIDAKQRLWMFWIVVQANRWEHSILKYRRSEDYLGSGVPRWSWQDVIHLVPGESFAKAVKQAFDQMELEEGMWAEYAPPYSRMIVEATGDKIKRQMGWMTRIHPLALPSGRILLPLYSDGFNVSLAAVSDDLGETWRPSQPIVGLGPIQPSLVRRKDGSLAAYMRDSGDDPGRVLFSTSADDGLTWTIATDTDIPNPGSSLEVIALQDGRWVMVYNDTEQGRHSLALALSEDEGVTWKAKRHVERSAGRESFAYPSIIQSRDGRLHLTYSYKGAGGSTIKHASMDVEWIERAE